MNAEDVIIIQDEEKRATEWQGELPFNIIDNFNYVGAGKFATCGHVAGVARQQGCPEPCMLGFTPGGTHGKTSVLT
jgi:hypothetical protein